MTWQYWPRLTIKEIQMYNANREWSLPPLALIMIKAFAESAKVIVEIGSGVSTDILARHTEGELYVVEWNPIYRNRIRKGTVCKDYNEVPDCKADLLIIDCSAPVAKSNRFTDEAWKLFKRIVEKRTVILVDDTDRKDEMTGSALLAALFNKTLTNYKDRNGLFTLLR